ncbi:DUF896 domain-containing protein [Lapidilactobacillus bayanensis]|uniref:DUF896 domain-containing protein n=1 Tax=Lapidilactobacillus bayanensis TaxID=2485998 RepID=UPI000F787037|nr:DUF896 domain-containing protein [Lapidilactobacillus bayanensis]
MSEIDPKLIARINELAAKAKKGELTDKETAERADLRKAYLKEFRAGFRTQVENLRVFDKDGKEVTPQKVRRIQKEKDLRDNE